jgi:hypothetical protein
MLNSRNIRIVALALLLACTASFAVAIAQTAKKPAKTVRTKTTPIPAADSLAIVHADSLRRALQERADSLRRAEQSEFDRKRADSLMTFRLRKIEQKAFGVGERLVFDVNYGFITAGEAVMWIPRYDTIAGRVCYRVEFTVNSLPSFSWIYKVEDRYYTFLDVQTIAPWRFEQHIREGNYRRDFIAEFDQHLHVAKTVEGQYETPPYVHDIMSAFYYARTLDYSESKTGDIYTLFNFYKDTTHELGVKFLGRQELEVEAGTYNTVVVEPLVKEGGLFKSEGRIVIWLTDDELKIPIRVNTKVIIGSIDTELREYSGLQTSPRSRVK